MLGNYLKTALRTFARHRGFAAINLGGLAVGLAACLLVGLFVRDELAYDRFHEDGERIFRLGGSSVGWPYGRILEAEYPEVEEVLYMRTHPVYSIRHEGTNHYVPMLYAENGFFDFFDFPLIEGASESALRLPYSVVLSESFAQTLFGSEPAVGRTLILGDSLQFTVTGVARVQGRSHIRFSALVSFETLRVLNSAWFEEEMASGWLDLNVVNYLRLQEGVDAAAFALKIRDLPVQRAGEYLSNWGSEYRLSLEPMTDIYLRSQAGNSLGPKGSIATVRLLGAIGLFLLLIAVVNFINLTTSRSVDRAREVGVRKVMGSNRSALVRQFLGESILTCSIAVLLAYALAFLALPLFNDLSARTYTPGELATWPVALSLVALAVTVGALAGLYPAFALSSFRPIDVMAGRFAAGRAGSRLRQGLVVFQFVISGVLVIGTLVIMGQLRFMRGQDLGFDAEQVLILDARRAAPRDLVGRGEAFKRELLSHASVQRVSATSYVPGRGGWRGQLSFPEGMPDGESVSLEYVPVDFDYVTTLGLRLVAGRDFDESFGTDSDAAVIINEAAVAAARWASPEDAIGKRFTSPGSGKPDGTVVGVIQDYHHRGLKERIEPMMFGIRTGGGLFAIRFQGGSAPETLAHSRATWARFFDDLAFEYAFLDEDFARQYDQDRRLSRIFLAFALLTILIASLGLFGLAAFTAAQRTKEIGVRKVLGASSLAIVALLSRNFLANVLIAFVVSVPIAYFAMSRWLEQFAYRTDIGLDTLLLGGLVLALVSLATVSYQALRAANADPVRSLRYE